MKSDGASRRSAMVEKGGGGREVKRRLMGELTEKLLVFRVVTGRLIVAGVVMTFRHVFQCSS